MGVTAYSLGRLSLLAALLHIGVGHAQTSVTPTRLQGDLKTNVTFGGGAYDITGGTRSDNKTGPNLFHRTAPVLHAPAAGGHDQCLAKRVSVPRGSSAGFERDTGTGNARRIGRLE